MTLVELIVALTLSAILLVGLSGTLTLSMRALDESKSFASGDRWIESLRQILQRDVESAREWTAEPNRMVLSGVFGYTSGRTGALQCATQVEYAVVSSNTGVILTRITSLRDASGRLTKNTRRLAVWADVSTASFRLLRFDVIENDFVVFELASERTRDLPAVPFLVRIRGRRSDSSQALIIWECITFPGDSVHGRF